MHAGEVRELIPHLINVDLRARLSNELDREEQLLDDWIEFRKGEAQDFATWCREQGRHYPWVEAFYYDR